MRKSMGEAKPCLFCNEIANFNGLGPLNLAYRVECSNCGIYAISDRLADQDRDTVKEYNPYKHLISGFIREKYNLGLQMEMITTENIMSLVNDSSIPKTIMQKLDKILLYYYGKSKTYGERLIANETTPYAIGYAINYEEFVNMIKTLIDHEIFIQTLHGGNMRHFSISFKGLRRAEEISSTNINSKKVFVAMGFKDDLLEAHKLAIQPACSECGFNALLINETEHNIGITDRIISEIKSSKFVITDFTYNNQGAYFEAGYAQGKGLEVIRTCNKQWFDGDDDNGVKNRLHFDISHYNFILWENYEDLRIKLIVAAELKCPKADGLACP